MSEIIYKCTGKLFQKKLAFRSLKEVHSAPAKDTFLLTSPAIRRLLVSGDFVDADGESVDFNDRIVHAGIYYSYMMSGRSWNPLNWIIYHECVIFKTESSDGTSFWWWSIEKNGEFITIIRSRMKETLFKQMDYPKPITACSIILTEERLLKHVFTELYKCGQLENVYKLDNANCQHFAAFIWSIISWKGTMEKFEDNKKESDFDELRNRGRRAEMSSININRDQVSMISTKFQTLADGKKKAVGAVVLTRHRNGHTPLIQAIFEGSFEDVQDELEDEEYRPVEEELPLHAAAQLGRDDVVQYLLEKVHLWTSNFTSLDDVLNNSLEDGYLTALYQAVMPGLSSLKTVKSLTTKENVNTADKDGRSPLNWAVQNRSIAIIEYLVTIETIDLNARDVRGRTPLHWASETIKQQDSFENIIESLKTAVNVTIPDGKGMTPLHCAIRSRYWYLVPHILTESNVNIQDNNGDTPLHLAVYFGGHSDNFELLLSKSGADPNIVNHRGKTPLDILVEKRMEGSSVVDYYRIFQVLRKRGAVSFSQSDATLMEKVFILDIKPEENVIAADRMNGFSSLLWKICLIILLFFMFYYVYSTCTN